MRRWIPAFAGMTALRISTYWQASQYSGFSSEQNTAALA